MALNKKCPKCGCQHVQLSNERSKITFRMDIHFLAFY